MSGNAMNVQKNPFPYYVGVESLHTIAHKHTRVCVMNILGNESSVVTPVSHSYSGGNIVAGVQFGRSGGALETPIGDIPVYGSIKEVLDSGVEFDTGVIYLPPAAVNHAVSEMCARNDALEKIVILTEKVSVRDAMLIRFGCQRRKVDVFGGNCLGIANPWDHVRVGGALGGDNPAESLKKGSVAIYSNSGNFSTTIAEYLKTSGFGTSTILSSGKYVYIHFSVAEFLYCAENDPRTKAIVLYIEPGGYYEKVALDWIKEGRFNLTKPVVACVTGRWKSNITRACGHAGAMAGSGDDAIAKEEWFDDYFGVGLFDPDNPDVSEKGVRISSIQEVPAAIAAVMKKVGEEPDFTPIGDLSLKPWFVGEQDVQFPEKLALKRVRAFGPYGDRIDKATRLVGAQVPRENMRNKSGASFMNRETQVTELYGTPVLDLVEHPFGGTAFFALTKEMPEDAHYPLVNGLLNYFTAKGAERIDSALRGRENGCTPNAYLGAEVLLSGNNAFVAEFKQMITALIDMFHGEVDQSLSIDKKLLQTKLQKKGLFKANPCSKQEEAVLGFFTDLIKKQKLDNILTSFAQEYSAAEKKDKKRGNALTLMLAACTLTVIWKSLASRRIVRNTADDIGSYLWVYGLIVGCAPTSPDKNPFWKSLKDFSDLKLLGTDYAESCFRILFNREGKKKELFALNSLLNLTVTNGPGTLSAKGSKESVSAKNQIPTAFAGFMTNTGIAHGGNGFEAIAFLIEKFGDLDPYKANKQELEEKLKSIAGKAAEDYLHYKKKAKAEGNLNYAKVPCVNHPVFKNKPVNVDPREEFIWNLFEKKKMVNPFQVFYHHLVKEMFEVGATKNVFCVNIDAVIATISLELFWDQMKKGQITEKEMQDIVFIMFLIGRMTGVASEIADHLARGNDMDCRTPASQVGFVA